MSSVCTVQCCDDCIFKGAVHSAALSYLVKAQTSLSKQQSTEQP